MLLRFPPNVLFYVLNEWTEAVAPTLINIPIVSIKTETPDKIRYSFSVLVTEIRFCDTAYPG